MYIWAVNANGYIRCPSKACISQVKTPLPSIMIIVLLKVAFLFFFFVLTSAKAITGNNILCLFEATLQPLCNADRDSGIFCTADKELSTAALNSQNLPLLQPALLQLFCEAILQCCNSAARFVQAVSAFILNAYTSSLKPLAGLTLVHFQVHFKGSFFLNDDLLY